ncbi:hypothetical protein GY45DRAFT_344997 [Cubamyces sp. BRFM 1775]|nr:hypothetical protein GY45DRAFT_344997 [Cubamyces sp. BRFM 1775]
MSLVQSVLQRISHGLTSTFALYLKGAVVSKFSAHRLVAADNGIRRHNPGMDLCYGHLYPLYRYSGLKRFGPAIATSLGLGFARQLRLAPPRPWCIPLSPRPRIQPLHEHVAASGSSLPRRHEASSSFYGTPTNSTYADIDVSERTYDSLHDSSNDISLKEHPLLHYDHPRTPSPFQLQEVSSDIPTEAQVPLYFPPPMPKLGLLQLPVIPENYLRAHVQANEAPDNAWPQVLGVQGTTHEHFPVDADALGNPGNHHVNPLPTVYQPILDGRHVPAQAGWNASPLHPHGPAVYIASSPHHLSPKAPRQAWPAQHVPDACFLHAPLQFYPSPTSDEHAAQVMEHPPIGAAPHAYASAQLQWPVGAVPPQPQENAMAPHPGLTNPTIVQAGVPHWRPTTMTTGAIGGPVNPVQGYLRKPFAPAMPATPRHNAIAPNAVAGPSGWPPPSQQVNGLGMPGRGVEQTRAPSYGFPDPLDYQGPLNENSPSPWNGYLPPLHGYQPRLPGAPQPPPHPVLQGRTENILERDLEHPQQLPFVQNHLPRAYDGPIGAPPGLPPPQFRGFLGLGYGHNPIAGNLQPHVANLAFGLRSDQDEIVVPNRRVHQGSPAHAPGGGFWGVPGARPEVQWVNNITGLPKIYTNASLLLPEPRDDELRERWQNQPPYYTTDVDELIFEEPIISRNGVQLKITSRIAHAGGGRVMMCVHIHTGKVYAAKVVHKYFAKALCGIPREALQTEKAVMARITDRNASPYLLKLLMSWEDRDIVFFILACLRSRVTTGKQRANYGARQRDLLC